MSKKKPGLKLSSYVTVPSVNVCAECQVRNPAQMHPSDQVWTGRLDQVKDQETSATPLGRGLIQRGVFTPEKRFDRFIPHFISQYFQQHIIRHLASQVQSLFSGKL